LVEETRVLKKTTNMSQVTDQLYHNVSVISWQSDLLVEETTNMSQVTDKLYHNISAISWWSVLLVEETRVPGENH
jgi:uncharacterized protein YpuA (DUF1002 family)